MMTDRRETAEDAAPQHAAATTRTGRLGYRRPSAGHLLVVAGVWFLATGSAALLQATTQRSGSLGQLLLEAVLYLGLAIWLASLPPLVSLFARLAPAYRVSIGLVLALTLFVQLGKQSRYFFPFAVWTMYSETIHPDARVLHYRYLGVTQDGRQVPINPIQIQPSLNNFRLTNRLRHLAAAAFSPVPGNSPPDPDRRELDAALYDELLQSLLVTYNRQHPEQPLESLVVERIYFTLDGNPEASTAIRTRVRHVRLSPAGETTNTPSKGPA